MGLYALQGRLNEAPLFAQYVSVKIDHYFSKGKVENTYDIFYLRLN